MHLVKDTGLYLGLLWVFESLFFSYSCWVEEGGISVCRGRWGHSVLTFTPLFLFLFSFSWHLPALISRIHPCPRPQITLHCWHRRLFTFFSDLHADRRGQPSPMRPLCSHSNQRSTPPSDPIPSASTSVASVTPSKSSAANRNTSSVSGSVSEAE